MKKTIAIILLLTILAGCSSAQSSETVSKLEENSVVSSSQGAVEQAESIESDEIVYEPTEEDAKLYNEKAENTFYAYLENSVVTDDFFNPMPEDFIPPEKMPEIQFTLNEMGYFVGEIHSADDKYEMWFSIDDLTYDGIKPKDSPKVNGVFFNKIA